ncbi:hypothetical protein H1Z61_15465 [Bacillus aquiflavi]|uniref:Uncharacterized protein n=1 Tax=Bacillus aquiflavi TaxID=2672567 RepID=A0A6B3W4D9_9BACI|nr:hypothetical protein [Bacillus aquiflavi]MBA4538491.1 hypothetical protein [Bacillus aquiflavi]NEY82853.1 hypothetical protein [Bacillus aquiflavi]UAC48596.1 hypothetical protein K6959_00900 [Bacillus aquiflavi]
MVLFIFEIVFLILGILGNSLCMIFLALDEMITEVALFFNKMVNYGKETIGGSLEDVDLIVQYAPVLTVVSILLALTALIMVIARKGLKISLVFIGFSFFITLILSISIDPFYGFNAAFTLFALALHIVRLEKTL